MKKRKCNWGIGPGAKRKSETGNAISKNITGLGIALILLQKKEMDQAKG